MNNIVLTESERQRLNRILECDLAKQKRVATLCFICSPLFLIGNAIFFSLVYGIGSSFKIAMVVALLFAILLFFVGMVRLGYYKLFRIIQALAGSEQNGRMTAKLT